MDTFINYIIGLFGTILSLIGLTLLFYNPVFGLIMLFVGGYFMYRSDKYVHWGNKRFPNDGE